MKFSSHHKVRYADCDPLGHLNNVKYLEYFMNAREDQVVQHYNKGFDEINVEAGGSFVAVSNQLAYLREVLPFQTCEITSHIFELKEKKTKMEMQMIVNGQISAFLWTEFLWMNFLDRRSGPIPTHLSQILIDNFIAPDETMINFETRKSALLKTNLI